MFQLAVKLLCDSSHKQQLYSLTKKKISQIQNIYKSKIKNWEWPFSNDNPSKFLAPEKNLFYNKKKILIELKLLYQSKKKKKKTN